MLKPTNGFRVAAPTHRAAYNLQHAWRAKERFHHVHLKCRRVDLNRIQCLTRRPLPALTPCPRRPDDRDARARLAAPRHNHNRGQVYRCSPPALAGAAWPHFRLRAQQRGKCRAATAPSQPHSTGIKHARDRRSMRERASRRAVVCEKAADPDVWATDLHSCSARS